METGKVPSNTPFPREAASKKIFMVPTGLDRIMPDEA
jgi:hypothetical protein